MNKKPKATITTQERAYNGFLKVDRLVIERENFEGGAPVTLTREVMDRGDAVAILLYDPAQDVVVLGREMRAGILHAGEDPFTYSLVAGGVKPKESLTRAVRREVKEEVGLKVDEVQIIERRLYSSAGGTSERISIGFGIISAPRGKGKVFGLKTEHEDIQRVVMPSTKFFELSGSRKMPDMMTRIAAYWLQANRPALRQRYAPAT